MTLASILETELIKKFNKILIHYSCNTSLRAYSISFQLVLVKTSISGDRGIQRSHMDARNLCRYLKGAGLMGSS